MDFIEQYLSEASQVLSQLNRHEIERCIDLLAATREQEGRLFILGVGGSAGNASHAVNDFRKIAGIESYSPSDNVSELTARTNDEGWDTTYAAWLKVSQLSSKDMLFVFSVGGGDAERNISANIVNALKLAKETGSEIIGVVGRDGGYTAKVTNACVIVPTINKDYITPHTESFQALIWHLLVSDPRLQQMSNKWESQK